MVIDMKTLIRLVIPAQAGIHLKVGWAMPTLYSVLMLLALLSGCTMLRGPSAQDTGHFYLNPYADISGVGKVVVFELDNRTSYPALSAALTDELSQALRKKHIFTLNTLHHTDPKWRNLDLNVSNFYSLEELASIRQQLKADAVLFGSITRYDPFPHMLMSLHLKLIDLRNGKLLWAIEQVWDTSDKRLEQRMKQYYKDQVRTGYEPMDWELLITSPRNFNRFVVYEVSATLPDANRYAQPPSSSENRLNFSGKSNILQKTLELPQKTLKFAAELTTIR